MNTKKKVLSIILALILALSTFAVAPSAAAGSTSGKDPAHAVPISLKDTKGTVTAVKGVCDTITDEDYYKITAPANGKLMVNFIHYQNDYCDEKYRVKIYKDTADLKDTPIVNEDIPVKSPKNVTLPYIGAVKGCTYYIYIEPLGRSKIIGKEYTLQVSFVSNAYLEQEVNDSQASATPIKINQTFSGVINRKRDKDYYKVVAPADGTLTVNFIHEVLENSDSGWAVATEEPINNYYYYQVGYQYIRQRDSSTISVWSGSVKKGKTYYIGVYILQDVGVVGADYKIRCNFSLPVLKKTSFTSGAGSVKLSWNKAPQASGYQIRIKQNGKWKDYAKTTAVSYTAKSLKPAVAYDFAVRSYYTAGGVTSYSGWAFIHTATKPLTPNLRYLKTNTSHVINAVWKARAGSGYYIQISTTKNFSKNVVTKKVTGKPSYFFKKLKKGTRYYVRVRAFKTYGNNKRVYSALSAVKSIVCK